MSVGPTPARFFRLLGSRPNFKLCQRFFCPHHSYLREKGESNVCCSATSLKAKEDPISKGVSPPLDPPLKAGGTKDVHP